MALKPEDRYASARALAEDVTRWLDDEPVSAHREPIAVRARRWIRRHRTLVTSTAAVLVLGAFGLAGFTTVLAGKNRELERQRQRAEAREALAIDAVKKFRDAVTANPELKNRLELDPLRRMLLKEPLEFFRKLRDQLHSDNDRRPDALSKLAAANFDLATTTAEIGSVLDAVRSYTESIAIFERLTRDDPAVTKYQVNLAASHNNIGVMLGKTGHPAEALESHRRAMMIQERLARDNPAVAQLQNDLAGSHNNMGSLLRVTGHPTEALESFRQALAIGERLVREHPTVIEYQNDLSHSHGNFGILLHNMGRPVEALESCRRVVAIQERLVHDHPTVTEFARALSVGHNNTGILLSSTGHPIEALESYRRGLEIQERLARDNPAVTQFQGDLANSHDNLGDLQNATGHPSEALDSHRRALEIRERLARDNPAVTQFQDAVAGSHDSMGSLLCDAGRPAEALGSYRRALEIRERLARDDPSAYENQSNLGVTLHNMAEIEMDQGRWKEARLGLERAIAHQRAALAAMPGNPFIQGFYRAHLLNLAKVYQALNQPADAVRTARELAAQSIGSATDLYNVACALAPRGALTRDEQKQALAAEAVRTLKEAIAAGWSDAAKTSCAPDLAPLRDRDDFRRLLAELFDRGFPADPFAP
jgi:tetratricopeptide (TPR) repeat protein